ncbi:glycoside hydrolase family 3 N-terminal domain-containing protein [Haoranjiania flava]|uniref:beta-glucosidase n=1 Tax=Haoranjiania flava TaxID=1856322 RepID=A0AAE3IJV9_9BACT|nr:glycoside hydrolase family 3 N-terminal domain-containing protein [Haoranjiania flava]MCU7693385.1 glycoside hydrolase family 3 C-terminal domain-containing protein [Haoranjiania flava]
MMKKLYRFLDLAFIAIISLCSAEVQAQKESVQTSIEKTLAAMTLEEKVGQMAQITLDVIAEGGNRYASSEPLRLNKKELEKALLKYHVGSILNTTNNRARTPEVWNKIIAEIQDIAINKSRMKIPVIYGIDAIHGATYSVGATMFPQQIALAATFNPQHAFETARVTAYETRACGIAWNFSPVLDIGADQRFSRLFENFGEDPYLSSVMGEQMVKGYEGGNIADPHHVASCIKHFLGYSVPRSGKDRTPAYIPYHQLLEYHVPPFRKAIDAGAKTVMINSGLINDIPVHSDKAVVTGLLQQKLGFSGLIVSDWNDIENLMRRDHVAANMKEAIALAVNAGIDMSMIPYQYEEFCDNLVALVKEGKVKQERIDDAVRKIVKLKYELNLFQQPITYIKDYPDYGSAKFARLSYNAAAEAITLLKNEKQILPLKKGAKILVTGPNANSMRPINGGWSYSWQGEKTDEFAKDYNTFFEAIANEFGTQHVQYIPGVSYSKEIEYYKQYKDQFNLIANAVRSSDVVIVCIGENSYTEKPGDLSDLSLSDLQVELVKEVAKGGKPVILILNEGRPRVISKIEHLADVIIQTYLPGNYGGDALADILSGKINPSGKLPYTYPGAPSSLINYYHKPSEAQEKMEGAYNYQSTPESQYPFGFGLSYTTFKYDNLTVDKNVFSINDEINITVDVSNIGKNAGKEVVMLFSSDMVASLTPDIKRLRRFEKIELDKGEKKTVHFKIKAAELGFIGTDGLLKLEPGEFNLQIEKLSRKIRLK